MARTDNIVKAFPLPEAIGGRLSPEADQTHARQYTICEMQPSHGHDVGRLHATCIEYSFLSGLGASFLSRLYESLIASHYGFGYVLLRNDQVVGFSFGRVHRSHSMVNLIHTSWKRLLIPLITLPFRHPVALFRSLVGLMQSGHVINEPGVGELLSIAATPDARERANGYRMLNRLFERFKQEGCHKAAWATHGKNLRALTFFEDSGGHITQETQISDRSIVWFERDL